MTGNEPQRAGGSRDGGVAEAAGVRVWDLPVRVFHWSIVGLVALSWVSAENGFLKLHLWSGLALLTLVLFRIAWGVVGSTTARFSDFIYRPGRALAYLAAMRRGEHVAHAGHNPAGGWMVIMLLAVLLLQAGTGLFANDGVHFNGPLAAQISSALSDRLTSVHGILFNAILLLVWMHIVAVLFYRYVRGEHLIAAMVSGKKPRREVCADAVLQFAPQRRALAWLALAAGLVYWIVKA
jgi:cytochrome b